MSSTCSWFSIHIPLLSHSTGLHECDCCIDTKLIDGTAVAHSVRSFVGKMRVADTIVSAESVEEHHGSSIGLGLAALGIVFGDIGTSPLYTFKTILDLAGGKSEPSVILGLLSLVVWTLMITTSIKYVIFAMRVDNDGEGGILALMSLLGAKAKKRPVIIALGLFGAALIYGDGAVTPAISVLSALEGLDMATPFFKPYILPLAVAILIGLFAIQPLGTQTIGRAFGPVMVVWFLVIALLGISGILHHPGIFAAINPYYAIAYLTSHGLAGFLVLGGVFLCATGAEALYADMGHFGPSPIRLSWFAIVFPSLILCYAGQGAILIEGAPSNGNIFFLLCPHALIVPLVMLATVATVIASQSIITGAFSMTRQAIQLGWLPRLQIRQTSAEGYGQIYVGVVNWMLMVVTLGLTIGFGKSDNLAAAYGIAVSLTMLMTTALLFIAMREIWHWSLAAAGSVSAVFFAVDASFVAANLAKLFEGGYVPLLLAAFVYGIMVIWHRGAVVVAARMKDSVVPIEEFMAELTSNKIPRTPGTAVFLTRTSNDTPPVMAWQVKHNRALHSHCLVLHVTILPVPWLRGRDRISIHEIATDVWRGEAYYGFMERPDVPMLLDDCSARGCVVDLDDVTYYIAHEKVVHRESSDALPLWQETLFGMMERNALHYADFLRLPYDNVIEIGRQIAI